MSPAAPLPSGWLPTTKLREYVGATAARVTHDLAVASVDEAERNLLHLFTYHVTAPADRRRLVTDVMAYCAEQRPTTSLAVWLVISTTLISLHKPGKHPSARAVRRRNATPCAIFGCC